MDYQKIYKNNIESKECQEKQINGDGHAEEGEMHSYWRSREGSWRSYGSEEQAGWDLWRLGEGTPEMAGWPHGFSEHEFGQTPGDGEGQGSLACCSSWGLEESDTTWWLNDKSGFRKRKQLEQKHWRKVMEARHGKRVPVSGWSPGLRREHSGWSWIAEHHGRVAMVESALCSWAMASSWGFVSRTGPDRM